MESKKGKKNRKIGRGLRSPSHARYTAEMRWVKNKKRKIARHLRGHLGDKVAAKGLNNL